MTTTTKLTQSLLHETVDLGADPDDAIESLVGEPTSLDGADTLADKSEADLTDVIVLQQTDSKP
mgnify:CR=1 FL=1